MASVPVASTQEQLAPLPGVRQDTIASPALFDGADRELGQLGERMVNTGGALANIQSDIQRRQNADMVFRAETAAKTNYAQFQADSLQRRGAAAKGVTTDAADWWDKTYEDNSQNLENEVQKKVFRQAISTLRVQSMDQMALHESQQNRVSVTESGTASINSSINLAASQVGTPLQNQAIAAAKTDIYDRLKTLRAINGWTDDQYAAAENEKLTNLHMQVIQNINRADPEAAQEYFTFNKKEINGGQYDTIDKMIANGNFLLGAQKAADAIDYTKMTETEALQKVRDTTTGKMQRAAITEVRQRYSDQRGAAREDARDADDTAVKLWANTNDISTIPPDVWSRMSGATQLQLQTLADKKAKGEAIKPNAENLALYSNLMQLRRDDPDVFTDAAKTNLNNYAAVLTAEQMHELIGYQMKPEKPPKEETFNRQLSTMYNLMGWTPSQNRADMGAFETTARQAVRDEETRIGKTLSDEERQKILDRLVLPGEVISGHWWQNDPNKRYFEVYGTDEANRFQPIPSDKDYAAAKSALQRRGIADPTKQQITDTVKAAYGLRAAAPAAPSQVGQGTVLAPTSDDAMISKPSLAPIPASVQAQRDATRTGIINQELQDNPTDKNLQREVELDNKRKSAQEIYNAASLRYNHSATILSDAYSAGAQDETIAHLRADEARAKAEADRAYKEWDKLNK